MRTYPMHYYLYSSGQVAYMETHIESKIGKSMMTLLILVPSSLTCFPHNMCYSVDKLCVHIGYAMSSFG